jgi:plastocyanin
VINRFLDDRRVLLPVLLTAMAIAIGSVLIVMLSGDASGSTTAAVSSPSTAAGGAVSIDIADFKFAPVSVTVKAGAKVTWVNHDAAAHTAKAPASGGFDTGTLTKGDKKTLTLGKPGTYAYFCEFHPFMKATVIVR